MRPLTCSATSFESTCRILWQSLGARWTFDDYPFQTFTFQVMRTRPGMAPHIGIGTGMFRQVAAGQEAAVVTELRRAVEELLAGAPAPAAPFVEPDAVRAEREQIERQFAVRIQQGGDEHWTAADLHDLGDALRRCTAAERAFVGGFEFWRFSSETARAARLGGGRVAGDPGGLTEMDDQVPPRLARITIFNEGFGRAAQLEGGVRSTQRTQHGGVSFGVYIILHEIAHTIEGSGRFQRAIMDRYAGLLAGAQQPITNNPQARGTDVREIYCEGFARFHTDPDGLAERSRAIVAFFRAGQHLPHWSASEPRQQRVARSRRRARVPRIPSSASVRSLPNGRERRRDRALALDRDESRSCRRTA